MRDGSRALSQRVDRRRSPLILIGIVKAPRAKYSLLLPARLATCLPRETMKCLPPVICSSAATAGASALPHRSGLCGRPQADCGVQSDVVAGSRQDKSTAACSSCWEECCTSQKSLLRRNLPRHRPSTVIGTRTNGCQPTSAPLSPGILDACGGDPFTAEVADRKWSCHTRRNPRRPGQCSGPRRYARSASRRRFCLIRIRCSALGCRSACPGRASLGPTKVRRLIAMRNWRPENERAAVDAIIRKARAVGIGCAQWTAGSVETILASCIDGTSAQGFLLVSPADGRNGCGGSS